MQITTEMAKDPEVFSRNVDMLIRHCLRVKPRLLHTPCSTAATAQCSTDTVSAGLQTSQAIPVDVLNHLLWLCKQHDDNQAAHAVGDVLAEAVDACLEQVVLIACCLQACAGGSSAPPLRAPACPMEALPGWCSTIAVLQPPC
jgi:hypothetical protein